MACKKFFLYSLSVLVLITSTPIAFAGGDSPATPTGAGNPTAAADSGQSQGDDSPMSPRMDSMHVETNPIGGPPTSLVTSPPGAPATPIGVGIPTAAADSGQGSQQVGSPMPSKPGDDMGVGPNSAVDMSVDPMPYQPGDTFVTSTNKTPCNKHGGDSKHGHKGNKGKGRDRSGNRENGSTEVAAPGAYNPKPNRTFEGTELSPTAVPAGPINSAKAVKVGCAVISYGDKPWSDIFSQFDGINERGYLVGTSPSNGRLYCISFDKLHNYTYDIEPANYLEQHRHSSIGSCCCCIFINDLCGRVRNYHPDYDDGRKYEKWELIKYIKETQEECRKWCHAVKMANPNIYFLLIHDLSGFGDVNRLAWHYTVCGTISDYCERTWQSSHTRCQQFVDSMTIPINIKSISSLLFKKIPDYTSTLPCLVM